MMLHPVAVDQLCVTWARILEERHPELHDVTVSVVEGDGQRRPRPALGGKLDVVAVPDDLQSAVEGRRAA